MQIFKKILATIFNRNSDCSNNTPAELEQTIKQAENGDAESQCTLGWVYLHGKGVKQDFSVAYKYYKLAADQEVASAQYNLGAMYDNGDGVKQDDSEAVKYYKSAAEQGNADAIEALKTLQK